MSRDHLSLASEHPPLVGRRLNEPEREGTGAEENQSEHERPPLCVVIPEISVDRPSRTSVKAQKNRAPVLHGATLTCE